MHGSLPDPAAVAAVNIPPTRRRQFALLEQRQGVLHHLQDRELDVVRKHVGWELGNQVVMEVPAGRAYSGTQSKSAECLSATEAYTP